MAGVALSRIEMSVEFLPDGNYRLEEVVGGLEDDEPEQGSWRVLESEGDRFVIELTPAGDGGEETRRVEVTFAGDDRVEYVDSGRDQMPKFGLSRAAAN
jgi:hypothetical protein